MTIVTARKNRLLNWFFVITTFFVLGYFASSLVGCTAVPTTPGTTGPVTTLPGDTTPTQLKYRIGSIPKFGAQGGNVEVIQERLNANGAKLTVDGDFGNATLNAIKAFQKAKGLNPSGDISGGETLRLLGIYVGPTTENGEVPKPSTGIKLSWNSDSVPARQEWTNFVVGLVGGELYSTYASATDWGRFCARYPELTKDQKVHLFAETIARIALHESGWKPTSWMTESTMGDDPITKKQVRSEGLLQLSYQDIQWASYCEFDWSKDQYLASDDPKKTIFDPIKNLDCGLRILGRQITKTKKIILTSGVYWAVIRDNGKYSKIPAITAVTQKLPFCKAG